MDCSQCGAPARELRAEDAGFEVLGPGGWLELQRCPLCAALWACARHEPHGAQRFWTLWPGDEPRWSALLGSPDGAIALAEWHDALLRERWLDLPPRERAIVEAWRERTGRRLNAIDRTEPARFVARSGELARFLDRTPLAPAEPRSTSEPAHSPWPRRVALVGVGLVYGLCVGGLATLLGGLGHGWGSAADSIVAIAYVPVLALAWGMRAQRLGRILAALLVVLMLASDVGLVLATREEGWEYFTRSWSRQPLVTGLWAVLWFAWQGAALWILVAPSSRPRSGYSLAGGPR